MRLIDADKLIDNLDNMIPATDDGDYAMGIATAIQEVGRMAYEDYIEAIPVEWLRDFQHFLDEEAEKISKEKDKNPMDIIGETWQFLSMSQAIDITINKYGAENNLDKEIYGSEYIKRWKENETDR